MDGIAAALQRQAPLQGGLPPDARLRGPVVVVACDESGFSGSNLLDAATPVFTHASVDVDRDEAEAIVRQLRARSAPRHEELKSGPLLRGVEGADAAEWLLGALVGRGHVHVVDKESFLLGRIVDLFLVEPSYAAGTRLVRDGVRETLALRTAQPDDPAGWDRLLEAFVALVRTKRVREPDPAAVDRFVTARDRLLAGAGPAAAAVLARLTRERVLAVVARLVRGDREIPPPLEPLLPALAETVLHWSAGRRRVLVVHDEQSALTPDRLRRLQEVLGDADGGPVLAGLLPVDSRDDARVQVADLLAGVARRSGDPWGDPALRPFLSGQTSARSASR